ncbi:MAG: chloride channel protein [Bacteroidales bacterium]|nr:chloride channel protein [Bacteroidales bacterium]MBS3775258.1 chloride channel protein [Bacteroidales bacterium]
MIKDLLRRTTYEQDTFRLIFLAAVVGIISAFLAIGFRYLLFFFENLFFYQEVSGSEVSMVDHDLGLWVIIVPVIGGVFVGLITKYIAGEAKGHGVPEVMESVAVYGGKMRPRIVLFKALASALSIGSGGSVGREGPIIQVGSGAGSTVGQLLKLDSQQVKVLVGCGAAGGIAATFNTPVAGIIFALEIILLELKSRSFISLVIASFFATTVSRIVLGSHTAFDIPGYSFVSLYEIIFYLLLGILAGLTAVFLIRMVYDTEHFFENRIRIPVFLKPAFGGLVVGMIGYFLPQVFGYGYDTISDMLNQEIVLGTVILLFVFKIVAFLVTIGSGASGGIFSPSLFIGAALGAAFGWAINAPYPEITAPIGAYALVGMAALFAAVSRATFTAIIIIFEMTLNYNIILPLMFSCVIADLIAWSLSSDTIYTKKLSLRGIRISQDMEANILDTVRVGDTMSLIYGVPMNDRIQSIYKKFIEGNYNSTCVIDENRILKGMVSLNDINRIPPEEWEKPIKEYVRKPYAVTYADETLSEALYKMASHNVESLPVINNLEDYIVIGQVSRNEIISRMH